VIEYKYNEDKILIELKRYIDETYTGHYSQNKYQATEFIIDGGHGTGFCIGNVMKYAQRYGHKGTLEDGRKDLMKVIHYAIIAMYNHDMKTKKKEDLFDEVKENVNLYEHQKISLEENPIKTTWGNTSYPYQWTNGIGQTNVRQSSDRLDKDYDIDYVVYGGGFDPERK